MILIFDKMNFQRACTFWLKTSRHEFKFFEQYKFGNAWRWLIKIYESAIFIENDQFWSGGLTKIEIGLRHTTNPPHFRIFWVKKVINKKLLTGNVFFEKAHHHFKVILHLYSKHMRRHYPLKIRPDFDLKELKFFDFRKYVVLVIFRYLQIAFEGKYFGVDQVLTKIL